jgi:hypothetical protein
MCFSLCAGLGCRLEMKGQKTEREREKKEHEKA